MIDVKNNGRVDENGFVTAIKVGIKIDEQPILVSDANKNEKIDAEDAFNILKYSVGLIDKF